MEGVSGVGVGWGAEGRRGCGRVGVEWAAHMWKERDLTE